MYRLVIKNNIFGIGSTPFLYYFNKTYSENTSLLHLFSFMVHIRTITNSFQSSRDVFGTANSILTPPPVI